MRTRTGVGQAVVLLGTMAFLVVYIATSRSLLLRILAAVLLVFAAIVSLRRLRDRGRDDAQPVWTGEPAIHEYVVGNGYAAVIMPALGDGIESAVVVRWVRTVGEAVEIGAPLVEISTDKVETEVPAPATGILDAIYVAEGQAVAAGAPMAAISPRGGACGSQAPARHDLRA